MVRENIQVEILRHPTEEDWKRCKELALNTMGKKHARKEITDEWKRQILKSEHSPIRTLMFTIRMTIPYFASVHFSRHYSGVVHYVQSQRNDRQHNYDREKAPQDALVIHTMDINAQALMNIARKRLCNMADPTTKYIMEQICKKVEKVNPEFKDFLIPMCEYRHECPEFKSCGHYERKIRGLTYGI